MKKLLMLPFIFTISGCPGGADRLAFGEWRWVSVDSERVCFSVDKKDVLNYYSISSNKDNKINFTSDSGYKKIYVSYPDTCINVKLEKGYQYYSNFTLNDKNFRYNFFIDNNWNIVSLQGSM